MTNNSSTGDRFRCSVCSQLFSEIIALTFHIHGHLDHFSAKFYACFYCPNYYDDINKVIDHTAAEHGNDRTQFACKFCDKVFSTADEFVKHSQIASDSSVTFDCVVCGKTFESRELLRTHGATHKSGKCYHCASCSQQFSRIDDLNVHRRIHRNLPIYPCKHCTRLFVHAKSLSEHIRRNHHNCYTADDLLQIESISELAKISSTSDDLSIDLSKTAPNRALCSKRSTEEALLHHLARGFQCSICHMRFLRSNTLQVHFARNHESSLNDHDVRKMRIDPKMPLKADTLIRRKSKCFVCPATLDSRTDLFSHFVDQHHGNHPFQCTTCNSRFATDKLLLAHQSIHQVQRFNCDYCKMLFVHQTSLANHMQQHTGANLLHCDVCSIPYGNRKALQKHQRIHADGKPHACDLCGKCFAQSCDKVKHMRIHTGEKPYTCEDCGKRFTHLTSLKKHKLIHTGERHFQCTVCGKSFQHNNNLVVHMRTHTGERPYECELCRKSFTASSHYTDHMKIHTGERPFKCETCGKDFAHQASFSKHKRTHSGEKRFQCNVCHRHFSQSGHFKEHQRIHTGEKPFKCIECVKSFRRKDALNIHLKSHSLTKECEIGTN